MFEITDDFLAQAGFTSLKDEQKAALKQKVTESVQRKIGDRIAAQVGEERAEEVADSMGASPEQARAILAAIDSNYAQSEDFKNITQLGTSAGATEDQIAQEYAVLALLKHHGVEIAAVVQDAMNEAFTELTAVYQSATQAASEQGKA